VGERERERRGGEIGRERERERVGDSVRRGFANIPAAAAVVSC
jgi:hypothetical protein